MAKDKGSRDERADRLRVRGPKKGISLCSVDTVTAGWRSEPESMLSNSMWPSNLGEKPQTKDL